ncbi:hypothetical protein H696_04479 [Fonticula alba]|uniref:SEC7 domain-containing protein n=1 Tax=Fonticula alba TaxID=691883 RepID=A0A058Z456_FONAL|nr:hypothetical protein H696_04479 [Fonticula alba]KCV69059.1 hypothetical protein H696_04479 [Fonticula alba]|eukprot:XP_009496630.1 hypothetical protein H696_04479 [Fonticula alba]
MSQLFASITAAVRPSGPPHAAFFKTTVQELAATREAKRNAPLLEACQSVVDADFSLLSPHEIFRPLYLACILPSFSSRIVARALDTIQRLALAGVFFSRSDLAPLPPDPAAQAADQAASQQSRGLRGAFSPEVGLARVIDLPPEAALIDQVVATVCSCYVGPHTEDQIEQQVLKCISSLVTSPNSTVRGASLLLTIRCCLVIASTSVGSSTTAAASLASFNAAIDSLGLASTSSLRSLSSGTSSEPGSPHPGSASPAAGPAAAAAAPATSFTFTSAMVPPQLGGAPPASINHMTARALLEQIMQVVLSRVNTDKASSLSKLSSCYSLSSEAGPEGGSPAADATEDAAGSPVLAGAPSVPASPLGATGPGSGGRGATGKQDASLEASQAFADLLVQCTDAESDAIMVFRDLCRITMRGTMPLPPSVLGGVLRLSEDPPMADYVALVEHAGSGGPDDETAPGTLAGQTTESLRTLALDLLRQILDSAQLISPGPEFHLSATDILPVPGSSALLSGLCRGTLAEVWAGLRSGPHGGPPLPDLRALLCTAAIPVWRPSPAAQTLLLDSVRDCLVPALARHAGHISHSAAIPPWQATSNAQGLGPSMAHVALTAIEAGDLGSVAGRHMPGSQLAPPHVLQGASPGAGDGLLVPGRDPVFEAPAGPMALQRGAAWTVHAPHADRFVLSLHIFHSLISRWFPVLSDPCRALFSHLLFAPLTTWRSPPAPLRRAILDSLFLVIYAWPGRLVDFYANFDCSDRLMAADSLVFSRLVLILRGVALGDLGRNVAARGLFGAGLSPAGVSLRAMAAADGKSGSGGAASGPGGSLRLTGRTASQNVAAEAAAAAAAAAPPASASASASEHDDHPHAGEELTASQVQLLVQAAGAAATEGTHLRLRAVECLVALVSALAVWQRRQFQDLEAGIAPSASAAPAAQLAAAFDRKRRLLAAVGVLNRSQSRGLAALTRPSYPDGRALLAPVSEDPRGFAEFLSRAAAGNGCAPRYVQGVGGAASALCKRVLGELLSDASPALGGLLGAFVADQTPSMSGVPFVDALRGFLQPFRLPGEAQRIDRIMLAFAEQYYSSNAALAKELAAEARPGTPAGRASAINSNDAAYILAFSVIMLNVDLHSRQVKKRMSLDEFIRNNRGINTGGTDLPSWFLEEVYQDIRQREIVMEPATTHLDITSSAEAGAPPRAAADPLFARDMLDFIWPSLLRVAYVGCGVLPPQSSFLALPAAGPDPTGAVLLEGMWPAELLGDGLSQRGAPVSGSEALCALNEAASSMAFSMSTLAIQLSAHNGLHVSLASWIRALAGATGCLPALQQAVATMPAAQGAPAAGLPPAPPGAAAAVAAAAAAATSPAVLSSSTSTPEHPAQSSDPAAGPPAASVVDSASRTSLASVGSSSHDHEADTISLANSIGGESPTAHAPAEEDHLDVTTAESPTGGDFGPEVGANGDAKSPDRASFTGSMDQALASQQAPAAGAAAPVDSAAPRTLSALFTPPVASGAPSTPVAQRTASAPGAGTPATVARRRPKRPFTPTNLGVRNARALIALLDCARAELAGNYLDQLEWRFIAMCLSAALRFINRSQNQLVARQTPLALGDVPAEEALLDDLGLASDKFLSNSVSLSMPAVEMLFNSMIRVSKLEIDDVLTLTRQEVSLSAPEAVPLSLLSLENVVILALNNLLARSMVTGESARSQQVPVPAAVALRGATPAPAFPATGAWDPTGAWRSLWKPIGLHFERSIVTALTVVVQTGISTPPPPEPAAGPTSGSRSGGTLGRNAGGTVGRNAAAAAATAGPPPTAIQAARLLAARARTVAHLLVDSLRRLATKLLPREAGLFPAAMASATDFVAGESALAAMAAELAGSESALAQEVAGFLARGAAASPGGSVAPITGTGAAADLATLPGFIQADLALGGFQGQLLAPFANAFLYRLPFSTAGSLLNPSGGGRLALESPSEGDDLSATAVSGQPLHYRPAAHGQLAYSSLSSLAAAAFSGPGAGALAVDSDSGLLSPADIDSPTRDHEADPLAKFDYIDDALPGGSMPVDLKEIVVECICQLIRSYGEQMTGAWVPILAILRACSRERSFNIFKSAHAGLSLAVQRHFLGVVTGASNAPQRHQYTVLLSALTAFATPGALTDSLAARSGSVGVLSGNYDALALNAIGLFRQISVHIANIDAARQEWAMAGAASLPALACNLSGSGFLLRSPVHRDQALAEATAAAAAAAMAAAAAPGAADGGDADLSAFSRAVCFWLPLLAALTRVVRRGEADPRTKAAHALFGLLKKHAEDFSAGFWSVVMRAIILPLIRPALWSLDPPGRHGGGPVAAAPAAAGASHPPAPCGADIAEDSADRLAREICLAAGVPIRCLNTSTVAFRTHGGPGSGAASPLVGSGSSAATAVSAPSEPNLYHLSGLSSQLADAAKNFDIEWQSMTFMYLLRCLQELLAGHFTLRLRSDPGLCDRAFRLAPADNPHGATGVAHLVDMSLVVDADRPTLGEVLFRPIMRALSRSASASCGAVSTQSARFACDIWAGIVHRHAQDFSSGMWAIAIQPWGAGSWGGVCHWLLDNTPRVLSQVSWVKREIELTTRAFASDVQALDPAGVEQQRAGAGFLAAERACARLSNIVASIGDVFVSPDRAVVWNHISTANAFCLVTSLQEVRQWLSEYARSEAHGLVRALPGTGSPGSPGGGVPGAGASAPASPAASARIRLPSLLDQDIAVNSELLALLQRLWLDGPLRDRRLGLALTQPDTGDAPCLWAEVDRLLIDLMVDLLERYCQLHRTTPAQQYLTSGLQGSIPGGPLSRSGILAAMRREAAALAPIMIQQVLDFLLAGAETSSEAGAGSMAEDAPRTGRTFFRAHVARLYRPLVRLVGCDSEWTLAHGDSAGAASGSGSQSATGDSSPGSPHASGPVPLPARFRALLGRALLTVDVFVGISAGAAGTEDH